MRPGWSTLSYRTPSHLLYEISRFEQTNILLSPFVSDGVIPVLSGVIPCFCHFFEASWDLCDAVGRISGPFWSATSLDDIWKTKCPHCPTVNSQRFWMHLHSEKYIQPQYRPCFKINRPLPQSDRIWRNGAASLTPNLLRNSLCSQKGFIFSLRTTVFRFMIRQKGI